MTATLIRHIRWLLVPFFLCGLHTALAQFSANVQGTVTDPKGAVVPGAVVTLTNVSTNVRSTQTTRSAGEYRFDSILPGDYRLSVEASGFDKSVASVHVSAQETAGVNVMLQVGQATTTVNVTAAEQGLNPDETRIEYTLSTQDLVNLPLPDRSTITSIRLAPGVVGTIETSGSTNTNVPIGQPTPDARANGRPASSNLYLLDRIPITSTETPGALNIVPNPDMLSEVALQTTTFSVENGATSSLQVDLTSKTGGNVFHGDIDGTYTSKPFEANPDFSAGVNPFHRRYFLGSFGGPIIKDHTFFFGSFERVDNVSALGSQTQAFATGANSWGSWVSQTFPNVPFAKLFSYSPGSLANQTPFLKASDVYPTAGGNYGDGWSCGTPATYNLPCDTTILVQGNFNQSPTIKGQQYILRFDESLHQDKDRLYFSYFGFQQNSEYLDVRPDFDTTTPGQAYLFSAGYSHVFTPTLINQFNAGLSRVWGGSVANPNYAIFPHATCFCFERESAGFVGEADTPYIGNDTKEHLFSLRDYVSWNKGRHSFRFGFQTQIPDYWQNDAAVYSRPYNNWFTDLVEMAQGKSDTLALYTISASTGKWLGQYYGAQSKQFAGYVQDDWKIRPNLLLTLGIRWDDFGNPSRFGEQAAPYANTFLGKGTDLLARAAGAYAALVQHPFSSNRNANFLPRAGFSWSPAHNKNTVVRGGVGLYEDAISLSDVTANLPTSSPVRLTETLNDAAENCPGTIFCGDKPWTGVSAEAGLPGPYSWTGTQGTTPPYGIPYPSFTVTGFTARGLTTGPGGQIYPTDMHGVDPHLKPQSTVSWNLGVEQAFIDNIVFGLTYSGSYSYNQFFNTNSIDAPPGVTLSPGTPGYVAKPWTDVNKIVLFYNALSSNYNAMIATASQRKGSISWQASYLWAHSIGNPGTGDNPSPYNATAFYGTTNLDVRNRFTLSGAYEVRGMKSNGLLRVATHGWTLGGIVIAQAGTPFTVYSSDDVNNDGNQDGSNDLPNVSFVAGQNQHYGGYSRAQYKAGIFGSSCAGGLRDLNAAAGSQNQNCPFQKLTGGSNPLPNPNTFEGNEPYNAFRNPGYFDVDLSLQKKTELPWFHDQKSSLAIRAEGLNALNRANLNGFGTSINLSSSPFGQIQSAENPRIIQIGARFEF